MVSEIEKERERKKADREGEKNEAHEEDTVGLDVINCIFFISAHKRKTINEFTTHTHIRVHREHKVKQ